MSARDYVELGYAVVDFGTEPATPEAAALRAVLQRMRQDLYAFQAALARVTDERDYWREAYRKAAHNTNTGKLQ